MLTILDTVLNTLNNLPDCIESIDSLLTNLWLFFISIFVIWKMGNSLLIIVSRLFTTK